MTISIKDNIKAELGLGRFDNKPGYFQFTDQIIRFKNLKVAHITFIAPGINKLYVFYSVIDFNGPC